MSKILFKLSFIFELINLYFDNHDKRSKILLATHQGTNQGEIK
jgi:hypothetical protein